MITKKEMLSYMEKWSSPYSPINPIEPEEIKNEMKTFVRRMNSGDFQIFIDTLLIAKDIEIEAFMEFGFYYIEANANDICYELIKCLKPNGPWQVLELIGYTKKKEIYPDVIKIIDYDQLDQKTKLSLIWAINLLRNKSSLDYLINKKGKEKDKEILEEIDFAYENIINK